MKIYCFVLSIFIATAAIAQIEEVTFASDTLTLEGSLYIPDGDGPFPAAVLVHRSGPVNRYQTLDIIGTDCIYPNLTNKTVENFKDIAEHLFQKGIAALIYDKRSFTYDLDSITLSPKDFIVDIENSIDFLKAHPKISAENVFLIGYDQGSELIPIAAQSKNVAGLISLSGAVTPPDSLFAELYKKILIDCADDPSNANIVGNRFYREFEKLRNNELADSLPLTIRFPGYDPNDPFVFGYPNFWRDWIEMAEQVIDNYTAANLPILLIQGDEDFNVPLNDANRFENGLLAELLTTIEIFEGVNHLLTTADNPKVSSLVLESISIWINKISTIPTAIEETDLNDHFQIQYKNGYLEIQPVYYNQSYQNSFNFHSIMVTAMDGRILHQTTLQNKNVYTLPINPANRMVLVSLFDKQKVYSKVIGTN